MTYEMAIKLAHEEGFTYNCVKDKLYTPGVDTGFVVGSMYSGVVLPPHASRNFTALSAAIFTFANTHPASIIGGWYDHDSHQYYLDIVHKVNDEASAHAIAYENEQKAIFDLGANVVIPTNVHPRAVELVA